MAKPTLKLLGMDGNVFAVLGAASRAAKNAGWDKEKWAKVRAEAIKGDYDHVLQTLMKHFEVA